MDELAGLYIKLVAKDEGASEAIAEIDGWLKKAGHTAEELQKSLSVFGGNAKTMFLAAAGAADRYAASMADLQAAKVPLEVHMELAGKLADKWHGASRVASELQSKMGLLSQRGGGDVSAYYADEMSRLQFKQGQADRAHGLGYIDTPQYMERTAGIQAEMNALLQQASTKTDQYGQAQAFLASETARANAMVANEVTTVERLNAELVQLRQYQAMGVGDQTLIARGISGREAQLAGGDQALEDKRLQSRRDYYRWLSSEGNAAEAGNVSAQRSSNMETMNTLKLLERLLPAEEQHANRIRKYTEELQRGVITQDQFNRLQNHSVQTMNSQRAGGGKQTGQMAMQGSYAAQDFATVMAMGGSPQMAMMSATNNLSQMAMVAGMANPVLLSLAAAAITVGAAFVDWGKIVQNLSSILDGFTGRVREIPNAAAGVKNAMDFRANAVKQEFDANLAGQQKTPEQIAKEAEQLRANIQRLEQLQLEAQENIEKARGAATEQGRGKANQANLYRDTMGSIYGGVAGDLGKGFVESVMNAFGTRAQAVDYVNQSEGYLQAVKNLKEFTEQLDETNRKLRLTESVVPTAKNLEEERSLEEFRKQGEAAEQKAREKVRQMEQDAWKPGSASPLADKAQKSMDEFAEAMGNAGYDADTQALFNSQYAASTTGMLDEEINRLSKLNESKVSPQMMGFSQFGQSFQMSLMKPEDEAKKQRKEQIDILKETRDAIKAKHGGVYGP